MSDKLAYIRTAAVAALLTCSSVGVAQAAPEPLTEAQQVEVETRVDERLEEEAKDKFAGLDFGVGISVSFDLGGEQRISDAEVVGGVVRVTKSNDVRARVMLESHYFFLPDGEFLNVASGMWGIGPFIALQPGSDDIIEAAAMGVMMGFRRGAGKSESFNIGLGLIVDPSVRTLGDGIVAGQPLPNGETAVRYKETDQLGAVILASFSF